MAPHRHGGRVFVLTGHRAGNTHVLAYDNKAVACRLDVEVRKERVVTMAFHFVSDSAGHKTKRTTAGPGPGSGNNGLDQILAYAKKILFDQINVTLKKVAVHDTKINEDLGAKVIEDDGEWDKVVAKRDNAADLNVFFVWEYEPERGTDDKAAAGVRKQEGNCLMEDNIAAYIEHGWVLAHEIGHYLGHDDHTAEGADLLMSVKRTNCRINKAMAAKMK